MGRKATAPLVRFEHLFIPEPMSGCWLWLGAITRSGYAVFTDRGRRYVRGHRFAWEAYRGVVPADRMVCHRCDVRCCVNPDHLFLGTHAENMDDRNRKNRQAHNRPGAILNEAIVVDIRDRLLRGEKERALANEYRMARTTIADIKWRRTWSHIK